MRKIGDYHQINSDGNDSEAEIDTRKLIAKRNKKNKKSGGFQSMGLSNAVYRGILRKGYKVPTPIQRKCIPLIMEGKDVVAMARTGSGKTAAFLIPMFQRLQVRSAASGARCLIISPTRELASQTLKFIVELGKFTNLKAVAILGGDRMEDQFAAIHENPDIILATPGRFLHVVMEMDLKLTEVEYVVFDEADRLFEMGFLEQLREIINRLPEARQTLLFSATLPKLLVSFVKAGLDDPVLVRLDVENKLSENLKVAYLGCHSEDKLAILLHLLKCVIKPKELTMIFFATKHHIEYVSAVLEKAGISSTYIYSSLDQVARKCNVNKFRRKEVTVMLVTDVAARGIDIPLLDNVINYHFPAKSKLFVHRAGRVARAGRMGTAYSLVVPEEMPYVLDLHLFLGRALQYASAPPSSSDWSGIYGVVPQTVIDENDEALQLWHSTSIDLVNMKRVCGNAYKQYLKSRPLPSSESVRRMKDELKVNSVFPHPLFGVANDGVMQVEQCKFIESMKSYKPSATIFEINSTAKNVAMSVMKQIRQKHTIAIDKYQRRLKEEAQQKRDKVSEPTPEPSQIAEDDEIQDAFSSVIRTKKREHKRAFKTKRSKKPTENKDFRDEEYYLSYKPKDHFTEQGLGLEKPSFVQEASGAVLDFTGDDIRDLNQSRRQMKWDRKKKKFVQEGGKDKPVAKRIKTESGVWIPASYKSDLYKKWQKKSKAEQADDSDDEEVDEAPKDNDTPSLNKLIIPKRWRNNTKPKQSESGQRKREMKTPEEILKVRRVKSRKRRIQEKQRINNLKRRSFVRGK